MPTVRLVGVVPTRRTADEPARVADRGHHGQEAGDGPVLGLGPEVCELFIQHRFLALPVVDDERRLMGVADVSLFTDVHSTWPSGKRRRRRCTS